MDFYVAQIECARLEGYGKVSVILLVEKRSKFRTVVQYDPI